MGIAQKIDRFTRKVKSRFYRRDPNLWVFGEWFGNRCCDNCLYLANYVANNHPRIKAVWICKKNADTSLLDPAVTRVEMDSEEATQALRHAGVAVMNQGFVDFSDTTGGLDCAGALTVNLWHGVPWKKIGMDSQSGNSALRGLYAKMVCRMQTSELYLALSDEFARILQGAYFVPADRVILAGYPRNSLFYDEKALALGREKVLNALRENGKTAENVKIITYMPTFRDKTEQVFSFTQLKDDPRFQALLEKHNAVVVQKAHFVSDQRNGGGGESEDPRILNLNGLSAQELMAGTDLLVTDYSSCFFDFLMTDRPIIHYLYDYAYYSDEDRGLYYRAEDVVCGDAAADVRELLDALDTNLSEPEKNARLRQERRRRFMTYESEDACRRIFEAISQRIKA